MDYNAAKISTDGRSISFLIYADFKGDPHPSPLFSVRVYLPRAEYRADEFPDKGRFVGTSFAEDDVSPGGFRPKNEQSPQLLMKRVSICSISAPTFSVRRG